LTNLLIVKASTMWKQVSPIYHGDIRSYCSNRELLIGSR